MFIKLYLGISFITSISSLPKCFKPKDYINIDAVCQEAGGYIMIALLVNFLYNSRYIMLNYIMKLDTH